MLDFNLSSKLFSYDYNDQPIANGLVVASRSLNFPDTDFAAAALQTFGFSTTSLPIPTVTSDGLLWMSTSGFYDFELTLTGDTVPDLSSATEADLPDIIQNAFGAGDLDAMELSLYGDVLLAVELTADSIALSFGSETITFNVPAVSALPIGPLTFINAFANLSQFSELSDSDQGLVVSALDGLGATSVVFEDEFGDEATLILDGSSPAILESGELTFTLDGTATLGFGYFFEVLQAINSGGDAGASELLAAGFTGVTITDSNDVELGVLDFAGTGVGEDLVTVTGTSDNDAIGLDFFPTGVWGLGLINAVTQNDKSIDVLAGDGRDSVNISLNALIDSSNFYTTTITSLYADGGSGVDFLGLEAFGAIDRDLNLIYDHDAYNAAINSFYADLDTNIYDFTAYQAAVDAYNAIPPEDLGPDDVYPNQDDYIDPNLFDVAAYDADLLAFETQFIAQFGEIADEYRSINDDVYFLGDPDVDDRYAPAYDFETYNTDLDGWYNDPNGEPQPQLSEYRINTDLFDHQAHEDYFIAFNTYQNARPQTYDSKYVFAFHDEPEQIDFLTDAGGTFDDAAYLQALADFEEDFPEYAAAIAGEYPQDYDFRLSLISSDYLDPATGQDKLPFDYEALYDAQNDYHNLSYEDQQTTDYPEEADFRINEDLYDHAGLEAARAIYQEAYFYQPDAYFFFYNTTITADFAAGLATLTLGETELASIDIDGFENGGFYTEGNVVFIGDENDNVYVFFDSYDNVTYTFDGGAGTGDVFDLTGIYNYDTGEYGLTLDDLLDSVNVEQTGATSYEVTAGEDDAPSVYLDNVEFIRLSSDDRTSSIDYAVDAFAALFGPTENIGTDADETIDGGDRQDITTGLGGNDRILGREGDDSLDGGADNDTVYGQEGNDTLLGGDGDDRLSGGDDNDSLRGGDGDDTLLGGAGDDILRGDDGSNDLNGGSGNDSLYGGSLDDTLEGSSGDDLIVGGSGNDRAEGDDGADTLYGNNGDDTLEGGDDNDEISGGSGADSLLGGEGADTLNGGSGDDTLRGEAGENELDGGTGDDKLYGGVENDVLAGGDGADTLVGDSGDDLVNGNEDDDVIYGNAGDDTLLGDEGDDNLSGSTGNDVLEGGLGNDTLKGGNDDDDLSGGDDLDDLSGGAGADTLDGGDGNDILAGDDGADSLLGGEGADTLNGGEGDDTLRGNDGENVMNGEDGSDKLYGGNDADEMSGGLGDDTLVGGDGDDDATGDDGADIMYGGAGEDTLNGNDGDDWLSSGNDNDLVLGRNGDDTMRGGNGDDRFYGGADDDLIAGNNGNDTLNGGSGDDKLFAGGGDDVVIGGAGQDVLGGSSGADVFVFNSATDSEHGSATRDEIVDFEHGVDQIDLSAILSGMTFIGSAAYTGAGGEVRFNAAAERLYIDLDGAGGSDVSIDLTGVSILDAGDLIL